MDTTKKKNTIQREKKNSVIYTSSAIKNELNKIITFKNSQFQIEIKKEQVELIVKKRVHCFEFKVWIMHTGARTGGGRDRGHS